MNLRWLDDLVYPETCLGCGKGCMGRNRGRLESLCDWCAASVIELDEWSCERCGLPRLERGMCPDCLLEDLPYERLRSVFEYSGIISETLRRAKYGKETTALRLLTKWGEKGLKRCIEEGLEGEGVLTWVPMERRAAVRRGFDPPRLMLEWLGEKPISIFRKSRMGTRQAGLGSRDRKGVAARVFGLLPGVGGVIRGKRICVFDDVITTGSTMEAVGRLLLEGGAREVVGVSLARTADWTT